MLPLRCQLGSLQPGSKGFWQDSEHTRRSSTVPPGSHAAKFTALLLQ